MPLLSFSSPFLSKIDNLKHSKVKNRLAKKICLVFLDFMTQNQTVGKYGSWYENEVAGFVVFS